MIKVGDLVKSIQGWGVIDYVGIVLEIEEETEHAKVLLSKATTLGHQFHWFPTRKIEVLNASR